MTLGRTELPEPQPLHSVQSTLILTTVTSSQPGLLIPPKGIWGTLHLGSPYLGDPLGVSAHKLRHWLVNEFGQL